ncbi:MULTISPECIES: dephospho-CoA kinase [unclassified Cellulophaga]|uniref:dephospho-CoA kinase n=1 Tax=unclassified Cellulophaga TaxID=2634405 RepID=UPI0026E2BB75|nr:MULTISPECIES: dephospho-CoA kinase [unclassified Cellulophaga]MDO6490822.1 dephospho-CoA kinase [Cellulophaga sp. 2_MG-2023]MDO6493984.1 dephospho-CoA kinase [Cellulophaga sp. 3_MG-2023]
MKIVGLTGGIGSGKSTAAKMFADLGVPVYNSDLEAKQLMHTSVSVKEQIARLLGKDAYVNNVLNREYIAEKVFADASLLEQLNNIVHPVVREHFLEWTKKQDAPYVIQESAIIFENKNQDFYDYIILVTAPLEVRINRILKRDNTTREKILSRMNNQWTDEKKEKMSDFKLINEDIVNLELKINEIHSILRSLS